MLDWDLQSVKIYCLSVPPRERFCPHPVLEMIVNGGRKALGHRDIEGWGQKQKLLLQAYGASAHFSVQNFVLPCRKLLKGLNTIFQLCAFCRSYKVLEASDEKAEVFSLGSRIVPL